METQFASISSLNLDRQIHGSSFQTRRDGNRTGPDSPKGLMFRHGVVGRDVVNKKRRGADGPRPAEKMQRFAALRSKLAENVRSVGTAWMMANRGRGEPAQTSTSRHFWTFFSAKKVKNGAQHRSASKKVDNAKDCEPSWSEPI